MRDGEGRVVNTEKKRKDRKIGIKDGMILL